MWFYSEIKFSGKIFSLSSTRKQTKQKEREVVWIIRSNKNGVALITLKFILLIKISSIFFILSPTPTRHFESSLCPFSGLFVEISSSSFKWW